MQPPPKTFWQRKCTLKFSPNFCRALPSVGVRRLHAKRHDLTLPAKLVCSGMGHAKFGDLEAIKKRKMSLSSAAARYILRLEGHAGNRVYYSVLCNYLFLQSQHAVIRSECLQMDPNAYHGDSEVMLRRKLPAHSVQTSCVETSPHHPL